MGGWGSDIVDVSGRVSWWVHPGDVLLTVGAFQDMFMHKKMKLHESLDVDTWLLKCVKRGYRALVWDDNSKRICRGPMFHCNYQVPRS